MKLNILIVVLFLKTISSFAQTKGIVVDENNLPIPYVSVWVEGENIGTTSEEDGSFLLEINSEKNIVFSALGYQTKIVSSKEISKVILTSKVIELNEVFVEKRKGKNEVFIGDFSGIKLNSGVTNVGQENVHIWSKFIRFNEKIKEHPFIKSIEFVTHSQLKNALLRIRIFNIDSQGIPTGDEVEDDILIKIKKGTKNNILDLSKYNIKIQKEGILIGFEYLKLEQNAIIYNGKISSYEPSIKGFFSGGETLLKLNRDGTLIDGSPNYGNVEIALKIKLTN